MLAAKIVVLGKGIMSHRAIIRIATVCVLLLSAVAAPAAVKLPAVIGDNMVLQRGQPVPIWGLADKGEEVTVAIAGQTHKTKAGDDGRWKLTLDKLDVGQPLETTISGSSGSKITLKNVLVGEVWIGSGQSNMEMGVGGCNNAKDEIAAANYPQIRLFNVEKARAPQPATDVKGSWATCSPQNIANFSAAAYFFGRHLHKELNVPIGLIATSWGGTPAEFWTSRKALQANPALRAMAGGDSSCLYNGMIAPLVPYAIRGAIWYQGEANVGTAFKYRTLFPAMIANWRADWGQGDFPFGFVQIAPFGYHNAWGVNPAACAELWEAQRITLDVAPNTGMAVTLDITDGPAAIEAKNGQFDGIHPKNKQDVGRRLALWALAKVYGHDVVYSGPIYKSMTLEGDKIRLQFDHCGQGLVSRDGKPLTDFTIAGEDQKFLPAVATIDGDSVIVHSDKVAKPVAVRYAWYDTAIPNLSNKDGLPASPFRTDRWKGVTEP
jgi:sialate O-acetylesterase